MNKNAASRALDWLNAGNTGTGRDLAEAIGISHSHAVKVLHALATASQAQIIGTRRVTIRGPKAHIYALAAADAAPPANRTIVGQARASLPPLATVWMGAMQ